MERLDSSTDQTVLTINSTGSNKLSRQRISVNGIVQGVGFRPFVYNLAAKHQLAGFVTNTSRGVEIEVEGNAKTIDLFQKQLTAAAPPLAVIKDIRTHSIPPNGNTRFIIQPSKGDESVATLISPDVAVCDDCLGELFAPDDRRYYYPFINCTNCGPRYTIIENIPYDRPFTSMRAFNMCPECQSEYDDPSDRRFHAQPNACPKCGPHVTLFDASRNKIKTADPIQATVQLLKDGHVVAIKGLGGFHLAVDATNDSAVDELRERKGREEKPFAIMVQDLKQARNTCVLTPLEEGILTSPQTPIIIALKKEGHGLAESLAPGNDRFGIMLPYTPLHHLLMNFNFKGLVMTSANYSEEPICIDNEEAFERLATIADYFLIHNRSICLRSDDSVVIHLSGKVCKIRRSRGYAPRPVFVDSKGPAILAVGGELKNTICLLKDDLAFMSQHIGDLENLEAYQFFQKTIDHFQRIFEIQPELIVYDLHPQYLSTQWAKEQSEKPTLPVQHHHAHLAAGMAENHLSEPVIGIIMDGTGYGTDGTIWGGEILVGDYNQFERFAHFESVPLPGGDAAIKAPWRAAVAYLHKTYNGAIPDLPFLAHHEPSPITEMIEKQINSPLTSSCGRLFDAVAAMSGGKQTIRYEAQAAIEFMQQSDELAVRPFDYIFDKKGDHWEILIPPIIRSVVRALQNAESVAQISNRFHRTLIEIFTEIIEQAVKDTKITNIVLSGGVFQNQVLFEGLIPSLLKKGRRVYTHSQVPTNDGGIALGQAMIGREYLTKLNN